MGSSISIGRRHTGERESIRYTSQMISWHTPECRLFRFAVWNDFSAGQKRLKVGQRTEFTDSDVSAGQITTRCSARTLSFLTQCLLILTRTNTIVLVHRTLLDLFQCLPYLPLPAMKTKYKPHNVRHRLHSMSLLRREVSMYANLAGHQRVSHFVPYRLKTSPHTSHATFEYRLHKR